MTLPQTIQHEPEQTTMVAAIERMVRDPDISMDRLEQMLAMKERLDAKAAEQAFNAAFAAASAEFPTIPLKGTGHNSKPYAMLKDIVSLTRPVLSRHGLTLNWEVEIADKAVKVTARLRHTLGHSTSTTILLPADTSGSKNPVQALGSSQTYGERYTAQAILGLSLGDDSDDDGAAAGQAGGISLEQFEALRALLEQSGADEAKFLAFFKVDMLDDLPAARFADAEKMLRAKLAQKSHA